MKHLDIIFEKLFEKQLKENSKNCAYILKDSGLGRIRTGGLRHVKATS